MSGIPIELTEIQSLCLECPEDLDSMFSIDEMLSNITFRDGEPVLDFWLIQMNPRLCDFAIACAEDVSMNNEGSTGLVFISKLYETIFYRVKNPGGYFPSFLEEDQSVDEIVTVNGDQNCCNDLSGLPEYVVEILKLCGEYVKKPGLSSNPESFLYLNVEELADRIMDCVENRSQPSVE